MPVLFPELHHTHQLLYAIIDSWLIIVADYKYAELYTRLVSGIQLTIVNQVTIISLGLLMSIGRILPVPSFCL